MAAGACREVDTAVFDVVQSVRAPALDLAASIISVFGQTGLTIAVALLSVAALARWRKLPEPVIIAAAAIVGLIAYPLLQPQWVLR